LLKQKNISIKGGRSSQITLKISLVSNQVAIFLPVSPKVCFDLENLCKNSYPLKCYQNVVEKTKPMIHKFNFASKIKKLFINKKKLKDKYNMMVVSNNVLKLSNEDVVLIRPG
jgi:hypothetical protein